MNVQKIESLPPPPGVIGSLRAGFDAVSKHIGLILLPVALDIFLWLGPRLSVGGLVNPFFKLVFDEARENPDFLYGSPATHRFSIRIWRSDRTF